MFTCILVCLMCCSLANHIPLSVVTSVMHYKRRRPSVRTRILYIDFQLIATTHKYTDYFINLCYMGQNVQSQLSE